MALTKLNVFSGKERKYGIGNKNDTRPRKLESEDLRQAFLRAAKDLWGSNCPIEVKKINNGVIKVAVTSAPWRTAVLWARQEIVQKINSELGKEEIKKIVVWWD